jgi:hypothetical protein
MKGADLDGGHHVVGYASGGKVDGNTVSYECCIPRPADTDGLSVNWLECFDGSIEEQIAAIYAVRRLEVRKSGRYFVINVAKAIECVVGLCAAKIVHDPLEPEDGYPLPDPSHALITGLPNRDDPKAQLIGDLIARQVQSLHTPPV